MGEGGGRVRKEGTGGEREKTSAPAVRLSAFLGWRRGTVGLWGWTLPPLEPLSHALQEGYQGINTSNTPRHCATPSIQVFANPALGMVPALVEGSSLWEPHSHENRGESVLVPE